MPGRRNTNTLLHLALMALLALALGVMVAGVLTADWRLVVAAPLGWCALAVLVAAGLGFADRMQARVEGTPPGTPYSHPGGPVRVPEFREQCTGNVQSPLSLGPPERCSLDAGHDGDCQP